MHHTASNKAVDGCFGEGAACGLESPELMQVMAQINDKILHFFFLAAPDFVLGPGADYSVRNVLGIVQAAPELAAQVVKMRQAGQMMIEKFAGKVIHPVVVVPGGFAKSMTEAERLKCWRKAGSSWSSPSSALTLPRRISSTNWTPTPWGWGKSSPAFWVP